MNHDDPRPLAREIEAKARDWLATHPAPDPHCSVCAEVGGPHGVPVTGQRRENIARALWAAAYEHPQRAVWPDVGSILRDYYRRLADAAIAADDLRGRVEKLAEEFERLPGDMSLFADDVARWTRALLDGADT